MRRWFVIAALVAALVLLLPAAAWAKAAAYASPGGAILFAHHDLGDGSTAMLYVDVADFGRYSSECGVLYVVSTTVGQETEFSFVAWGNTALAAPAFKSTGGALTRATLTATVPLSTFDAFPPEGAGTPWGDAAVSLSWTGDGPISVDRQHYTLFDEVTGLFFTIISHGRSRSATVTGTLLLPDGSSWDLTAPSYEVDGAGLFTGHEVNISYRH